MINTQLLMEYWSHAVITCLVLLVFFNSVAVAGGAQFITVERRWFGKPMADGRTVALRAEVGVQARTLGPGIHFLVPFIYKISKHKFTTIGTTQIGIVRAITGMP